LPVDEEIGLAHGLGESEAELELELREIGGGDAVVKGVA